MIEVLPCVNSENQTIRLAGNLDVRNANNLQVELNEMVSQGKSVTVDCTTLESLDTACIQLLLAAKRNSRGTFQVKLEQGSEVSKWFDYAGVTNLLLESTDNTDGAKTGRKLP